MNTLHEGSVKLTLPFDVTGCAMLPIVGGKAANLGYSFDPC
jgi:phosphoenolpyruvate synthase/pyruvate phosphate dikinase